RGGELAVLDLNRLHRAAGGGSGLIHDMSSFGIGIGIVIVACGFWLLASGRWLLAAGFWPLAVGQKGLDLCSQIDGCSKPLRCVIPRI
ncbi:MAG: hypothetical protein ACOC3G_05890, partial [Phycisphaeraceae bacterium]